MDNALDDEKFFVQTLHKCLSSLFDEDDDGKPNNTHRKKVYYSLGHSTVSPLSTTHKITGGRLQKKGKNT